MSQGCLRYIENTLRIRAVVTPMTHAMHCPISDATTSLTTYKDLDMNTYMSSN